MNIVEKTIPNQNGREFAFDLRLPSTPPGPQGYPLLIFAHGFKGFKDWGHWYRLADCFALAGYAFLKFDYSMNGLRPGDQGVYSDLEAFGRNTFSQELGDWQRMLDWVSKHGEEYRLRTHSIGIIGHSRSGPIVLLTAARDSRVGCVLTWGSVSRLGYAWGDSALLKYWKQEGVIHSRNARTGQDMPLYYSLYEDLQQHRSAYSLPEALAGFTKPVLLVHGLEDEPVPPDSSRELHQWMSHAKLELLPGANHVFGGHHPFGKEEPLPDQAQRLMKVCLEFLDGDR
jgi:dienelactone hydrolase